MPAPSAFQQAADPRATTARPSRMLGRAFAALLLILLAAAAVACEGQAAVTPAQPAPAVTPVQPAAGATAQPSTPAPVASPLAPAPTPTAIPTAVITPPPTPPCIQPSLALGSGKFRIETLARAAAGSISVPQDKPDAAYWIEGTSVHYLFALSPTAANLALQSAVKSGDAVKIQWGDCSTEEYVVTSVESGQADLARLLDQSAGGLSVVVLPAAPAQSLVITAGRPQVQGAATPEPTEANAVQAELSFLGTQASADGKTLVMSVGVRNTGSAPLSLAAKDVSLGVENAAPAAPVSVAPPLPQTLAPGASQTFQITFPRPAGHTAVFKLLTFSADIYF